jgi:predicted nucleotidyltransferase
VGERLQSLIAELRRRIEALYGPRLVRLMLFGAQARGDAEPGSDIDVLVVREGPMRPGEEIRRTLDPVACRTTRSRITYTNGAAGFVYGSD